MINYLITFYQKFISPITHSLMAPFTHSLNACRFTPTCSQYTKKAVQRYGIITGLVLGTKRFLRCNPLFPGGHDPVPDLN